MKNEEDARDIIKQIQRLQAEQDALLTRLSRLSIRENEGNKQANSNHAPPHATKKEFAVGDRVKIKNPGLLQASKGEIEKIGKSRITVKTSTGSKIVRAPKNLSFEE